MNTSDEQLVSRCQTNDREAFGELYDRYIKPIYEFIFYKTHHVETAEDLTSEVFIKAFKKIDKYNPEKASFKTWLYRIARNTVIDHYRTQKPNSKDLLDVWDLSSSHDVERDVDLRIQSEKVFDYLTTLKPEHREIILLRLWNNLSFAEISDITGKSEGNCKVIASRVTKKMQAELAIAFLLFFIPLSL